MNANGDPVILQLRETVANLMKNMIEIADLLETVPEKESIKHEIRVLQARTEHSMILAKTRVYSNRMEPLVILKEMEDNGHV